MNDGDDLAFRVEDRLRSAGNVGRRHARQRRRHAAVRQHRQAARLIAHERIGDGHSRAQRGGARADQAVGGAAHLVGRDRSGGDARDHRAHGRHGRVEARRGTGHGNGEITGRRGIRHAGVGPAGKRAIVGERGGKAPALPAENLGEQLDRQARSVAGRGRRIADDRE